MSRMRLGNREAWTLILAERWARENLQKSDRYAQREDLKRAELKCRAERWDTKSETEWAFTNHLGSIDI